MRARRLAETVLAIALLCSIGQARYKGETIAPRWCVGLVSVGIFAGAFASPSGIQLPVAGRSGVAEFTYFAGPVGVGSALAETFYGLDVGSFAPIRVYLAPLHLPLSEGNLSPYLRASFSLYGTGLSESAEDEWLGILRSQGGRASYLDVSIGVEANPLRALPFDLALGVMTYKKDEYISVLGATEWYASLSTSLAFFGFRRGFPPPKLVVTAVYRGEPERGTGLVALAVKNEGDGPAVDVPIETEVLPGKYVGQVLVRTHRLSRLEPGDIQQLEIPVILSNQLPSTGVRLVCTATDKKGAVLFRTAEMSIAAQPVARTPVAETEPIPASTPSPHPTTASALQVPTRADVFAVIVGVSRHKSQGIPVLSHAESDASALYALMTGPGGSVPKENVRLLVGADATGAELKKNLTWLVNQARATNGLALLYFSGHGAPAQGASGEFKQAYLVPYDCDPDYLEETAIPVSDIEAKLAELDGRAFVALDACFSGKGRSFVKPGAKGVTLVPRNLGLKQEGKGVTFMTASKADQISTEYDAGKHGLFTYYLLDGLSGKADEAGNKDGWVDAAETYAYVRDKVNAEARKLNVEQEPELIGSAAGLNLTVNYDRFLKSSKEAKIAKVKAAFEAGQISSEQLSRAVKEINGGEEGRVLTEFIEGRIPVDVFKSTY